MDDVLHDLSLFFGVVAKLWFMFLAVIVSLIVLSVLEKADERRGDR